MTVKWNNNYITPNITSPHNNSNNSSCNDSRNSIRTVSRHNHDKYPILVFL